MEIKRPPAVRAEVSGRKAAGIGLALGGGGARGLAHIGVLRVLEDQGIPVGNIAGTSMGALVGGCYAAKGCVEPIERLALSLDWKYLARLFAPGFSISGIVNDERIRRFIAEFTGDSMIEGLGIPFAAVAADMETGAESVFSSGPLVNAIMASISIPAVFRPVREGDRILADGGLANPLPVSIARRLGPYPVVAVNVQQASGEFGKSGSINVKPGFDSLLASLKERFAPHQAISRAARKTTGGDDGTVRAARRSPTRKTGTPNLVQIFIQSVDLIEANLQTALLDQWPPDVLLSPDVDEIRLFDFHAAEKAIEAGKKAAMDAMPEIRRLANP
ncbi:patatin-like phospholipase family protein [bacterium]|nr:patatin-like phospholipase family protein [bacterium]